MNDVFQDFEWAVAPSYVWQPWVDSDGTPLTIPTDDLSGIDSEDAVLLTWSHASEQDLKHGPVLSPVIADLSDVRRYRPMRRENAALFREFADVDFSSQDAVRRFAGKYGLLGLPLQSQSVSFYLPSGEGTCNRAHGEPLLGWAAEICLMREGIRLGSRDRSAESSRRLKWLFDRHLQHVQARMAFDEARKPRVALEPLTLIAAMWLQLALAITGEKRFVACKYCRRTFEISTAQTGFRSHREFCSDSCKTQDYRKRKRTALSLVREGVRIAQIAEQIETEIATVRRWLASGKSSGAKGKRDALSTR